MATYYLLNTTTVTDSSGSHKYLAGSYIDTANVVTAPITAAGGVLWPSATAVVAAAAVIAQALHASKAGNEDACDKIMLAAVASQLNTVDEVNIATVTAAQVVDEAAIATAVAQLALLPARVQVGTITLASGTKSLATGIVITASSKVFVSLNTPGGTMGTNYKVPDASLVVGISGVGTFVASAVDGSGATVTTDTSTLNYMIVN